MLSLKVDFNAPRDGLVRGLAEEVDGTPALDDLILLDDGEGNEALGVVRRLAPGLVFSEVDWDTWGPTGHIKISPVSYESNGGGSVEFEVAERPELVAA